MNTFLLGCALEEFLEQFSSHFSDAQRISEVYFGVIVLFPIVKFIGIKPQTVFG
jgi:hypothetical protein